MHFSKSSIVEKDFDENACGACNRRDCVQEIVQDYALDVDSNDIDELVVEHSQELSTKELMELHSIASSCGEDFVREGRDKSISRATAFQ